MKQLLLHDFLLYILFSFNLNKGSIVFFYCKQQRNCITCISSPDRPCQRDLVCIVYYICSLGLRCSVYYLYTTRGGSHSSYCPCTHILNGFFCEFMKVDHNKIGNIIADEELRCRITEEYIA